MVDYKKISMDIPIDMHDWLKDHNINMSDLFRKAALNLMYEQHARLPPIFLLASVMSIMFSVVLISIGITPTPIHIITRLSLILIGGFMGIITTIYFYREKERCKNL